jgi:RNA recognition motif-containing protein
MQSLFLISKSNCAFANFSDEEACLEAQRILHDSKFQSVRLVCRLRKNSAEGATGVLSPTGHSGSNPASPVPDASPPNESDTEGREAPILVVGQRRPSETKTSDDKAPRPDRFFVLKSLTLEDLDLSVRTGVWATQAHNEESLNHAFKVSITTPKV